MFLRRGPIHLREKEGAAATGWERRQQIGHTAEVNRTGDRADEGVDGTPS
jgi:hypothetical protein